MCKAVDPEHEPKVTHNSYFQSLLCSSCMHLQAELRGTFMKRLQPRVCISRGQLRVIRKGAAPTVQISSERRQGNKHVTKIVGMEDFLVPADAVAQACQKRFACATTTAELPGKQKSSHEVIMQGNVVDKVAEYLISMYGVPKKYILVKK